MLANSSIILNDALYNLEKFGEKFGKKILKVKNTKLVLRRTSIQDKFCIKNGHILGFYVSHLLLMVTFNNSLWIPNLILRLSYVVHFKFQNN